MNSNNLKHIKVVAAIIRDVEGRVFATQRGYGKFKDYWEFPGGKIEVGESPEDALHREIMEELDTEIEIEGLFDAVEWDYPDFHLSMKCYACHVVSGSLTLKEHESAKWLLPAELNTVNWLPADAGVVEKLVETK